MNSVTILNTFKTLLELKRQSIQQRNTTQASTLNTAFFNTLSSGPAPTPNQNEGEIFTLLIRLLAQKQNQAENSTPQPPSSPVVRPNAIPSPPDPPVAFFTPAPNEPPVECLTPTLADPPMSYCPAEPPQVEPSPPDPPILGSSSYQGAVFSRRFSGFQADAQSHFLYASENVLNNLAAGNASLAHPAAYGFYAQFAHHEQMPAWVREAQEAQSLFSDEELQQLHVGQRGSLSIAYKNEAGQAQEFTLSLEEFTKQGYVKLSDGPATPLMDFLNDKLPHLVHQDLHVAINQAGYLFPELSIFVTNPENGDEVEATAFVINHTPIILDLDGNGVVETTSRQDGRKFSYNGTDQTQTAWVGGGDGLLFVDRNGDGKITDGSELFGNHAHLSNGNYANDGFEVLSEFDTNHDGLVNQDDANFGLLQVQKADGTVQSLTEAGVKSLNVNHAKSNYLDENGNAHTLLGSFTTLTGETRSMNDVLFNVHRLKQ